MLYVLSGPKYLLFNFDFVLIGGRVGVLENCFVFFFSVTLSSRSNLWIANGCFHSF